MSQPATKPSFDLCTAVWQSKQCLFKRKAYSLKSHPLDFFLKRRVLLHHLLTVFRITCLKWKKIEVLIRQSLNCCQTDIKRAASVFTMQLYKFVKLGLRFSSTPSRSESPAEPPAERAGIPVVRWIAHKTVRFSPPKKIACWKGSEFVRNRTTAISNCTQLPALLEGLSWKAFCVRLSALLRQFWIKAFWCPNCV